jgi:hypothetical protein
VAEFAEGLGELQRAVVDAVLEQELRFAGSSASRSHVRIVVRSKVVPRPEVATVEQAIDVLTGSYLKSNGGTQPSYQVTITGLLASAWGSNAVGVLDAVWTVLARFIEKNPSAQQYPWSAVREAARIPEKALNLAHLTITLADLGKGRFDHSGDKWWTVPPNPDLLFEHNAAALDYVTRLVSSACPPAQSSPAPSVVSGAGPTGDIKEVNESRSSAPRVFISYSHDDDPHKRWVLRLSERLREGGIDAILDQWDLRLGHDLAHFMEQGVAGSARVVMVCSTAYVKKANAGIGGVGYEKMIVTREVIADITTDRFIPVIRSNPEKSIPTFLGTRLYVDFDDDGAFEASLEALLRGIHDAPKAIKPPLGLNPFATNRGVNPSPTDPLAGPASAKAVDHGVLAEAAKITTAAKGIVYGSVEPVGPLLGDLRSSGPPPGYNGPPEPPSGVQYRSTNAPVVIGKMVPTVRQPVDVAQAIYGVSLDLNYLRLPNSDGEIHYYELRATLKNGSRKRLDDWYIEVELPTPVLDPDMPNATQVRSDRRITLFRTSDKLKPIFAGDEYTYSVRYRMNHDVFYAHQADLKSWEAKARAFVAGEQVADAQLTPIENF